uniref:Uncharacterized protein n=1 Tax=Glossina pallidipes TaxID=7398 RepID=A0A1B0A6I2_GLOPL
MNMSNKKNDLSGIQWSCDLNRDCGACTYNSCLDSLVGAAAVAVYAIALMSANVAFGGRVLVWSSSVLKCLNSICIKVWLQRFLQIFDLRTDFSGINTIVHRGTSYSNSKSSPFAIKQFVKETTITEKQYKKTKEVNNDYF